MVLLMTLTLPFELMLKTVFIGNNLVCVVPTLYSVFDDSVKTVNLIIRK